MNNSTTKRQGQGLKSSPPRCRRLPRQPLPNVPLSRLTLKASLQEFPTPPTNSLAVKPAGALLAPKQEQLLPPGPLSSPLDKSILTPKAPRHRRWSPAKAIDSSQVEPVVNSLLVNLIVLEEDFRLKNEAGMNFPPEVNDSITRKAIRQF